MFEVGFTELLLIFALALVVLGPRRLPELASRVGRWVGKARAMARQLREQLDQEVTFEENESTRRRKPGAAAAAAPQDDSDLEVDSQGRPYYPAGHHDADRPTSAAPDAQPAPSIVPPPGPSPTGTAEDETPGDTPQPQQAANERRGA